MSPVERRRTHIMYEFFTEAFIAGKLLYSHCIPEYIFNLSAEYRFPALHASIPSHSSIIRFVLPCFHFNCRRRNQCNEFASVCLKTFQLKRRIERGKFFLDATFRQVGAGWFNPFPLPLSCKICLSIPWRHALATAYATTVTALLPVNLPIRLNVYTPSSAGYVVAMVPVSSRLTRSLKCIL